jgi:hypothetical protein
MHERDEKCVQKNFSLKRIRKLIFGKPRRRWQTKLKYTFKNSSVNVLDLTGTEQEPVKGLLLTVIIFRFSVKEYFD